MSAQSSPHPGKIIRKTCLDPLDLSVTDAAKGLGVQRNALSKLLNARAGISPLMAIRLSIAFGESPESWLLRQMKYDLWVAKKQAKKLKIKTFLKHKNRFSKKGTSVKKKKNE